MYASFIIRDELGKIVLVHIISFIVARGIPLLTYIYIHYFIFIMYPRGEVMDELLEYVCRAYRRA